MADRASRLKESPSQTAGPYVHIGCAPNFAGITGIYGEDIGFVMVEKGARGQLISLSGRILDATGTPLTDGLVEIWQADAAGLYNSPSERRGAADPCFSGWGRSVADPETGIWSFRTLKPGPVPFPDGRMQAPHINLWIVARGINLGLNTRIYFPEEVKANAADPVLTGFDLGDRMETLIAARQGDHLTIDIHLQGDRETVFFDI